MKTLLRFFVLMAVVLTPFHVARSATKPTLKLYGATTGQLGDRGCHSFEGECLIFQEQPVVIHDFKVSAAGRPQYELAVSMYDGAAKELTQLTKKNLGGRLAVTVNDEVVQAPNVKAVTQQAGFVLSFRDEASYEKMKATLEGAAQDTK